MSSQFRKDLFNVHWQLVLTLCCLLVAAIIVVACSGSGSIMTASSGMATVNVMLSDPATCQAPMGHLPMCTSRLPMFRLA